MYKGHGVTDQSLPFAVVAVCGFYSLFGKSRKPCGRQAVGRQARGSRFRLLSAPVSPLQQFRFAVEYFKVLAFRV